MTAAVDAEACAVVATAADIICSLRAADLAGWTPPWRKPAAPADPSSRDDAPEQLAWPAVARGKRSRSRRGSSPSASAGSGSAAGSLSKKKQNKEARRARGSPASPLDYSAGSGASTSGGEDGAFCSPPPPVVTSGGGGGPHVVEPARKVVRLVGRRSILPVPPPRPAGQQRPRKKMRLPEIQQMVRSLSVENDALRQEMKALQKACSALSKENGKLETRLDQSSKREGIPASEEKKELKPQQPGHHATTEQQEAQNGFELPDLNLPAQDG